MSPVVCVECGRPIGRSEIGVLVAVENARGESLVTGRLPMHLVCSLNVVREVEALGGSARPG